MKALLIFTTVVLVLGVAVWLTRDVDPRDRAAILGGLGAMLTPVAAIVGRYR